MEARLTRAAIVAVAAFFSLGANYRTENFVVTADTPQLAAEVAQTAEQYRRQLAMEWLGQELPQWRQPCPIRAFVGPQLGAGGETTFSFSTYGGRSQPTFSHMKVYGPRDRVLDSVVPHEVLHTVFATYFGCPLPRWADEGACTTVEHSSERSKQERLLISFLTNVPSRGIAFNRLFTLTEYPSDMIPLYSQGYSLARYLIAQGGKQKFVQYLVMGMGLSDSRSSGSPFGPRESRRQVLDRWNAATSKFYGFEDLSDLQLSWLDWVARGTPPVQPRQMDVAAQTGIAQASRDRNELVDVQPREMQVAEADSWYLRQRGSAKRASSEEGEAAAPEDAGHEPFQPGSIKGAPSLMQMLDERQPHVLDSRQQGNLPRSNMLR